ncbi:unnamed protein product, partial [Hapterophycus canaliculatus]
GGPDGTALATALLAATGRPMEAVQRVLKGSEEALSLTVAVADGAYPPSGPPESSSEEIPLPPVGEKKGDSRWVKEGGGRSATEREAARISEENNRGTDSKLLALIDGHVEEGNAADSREDVAENMEQGGKEEEDAEEKTSSPKYGGLEKRGVLAPDGGSRRSGVRSPDMDARDAPSNESSGVKEGGAPAQLDPLHLQGSDSHQKAVSMTKAAAATAAATQRDHAEAALRSITQSKADAFFCASQPALAAAAMLSMCDGSRKTAAPALAFLVRGEEPELAFAAAKALKFPARELRPLIREMARRAEAWGDPDLSVELLLNAGGEDKGSDFGREEHTGSVDINHGSSLEETTHRRATDAESGYWSADVYGVCGQDAGPRGAALVATRAADGSSSSCSGKEACNINTKSRPNPCPSFALRSAASYLEDAAAAVSRGMDVEAVRLLVLGGSMEQAAQRGISFLRENVQPLTFPPKPLHESASAVVQALGSGSGGGLSSGRVPPRLRMEVLAYASYVGAIEAVVRGYNPVVAALLQTTAACVQAMERIAAESESQGGYRAHEGDEKSIENGEAEAAVARTQRRTRSRSPCRRWHATRRRAESPPRHGESRSPSPSSKGRQSGRSSPPRQPSSSRLFPPCMSVGALAMASFQHLNIWYEGGLLGATAPSHRPVAAPRNASESTNYAREVRLSFAHWIRDEAINLPPKDAKAVHALMSSAEHRASMRHAAASGRRHEFMMTSAKAERPAGGLESPTMSTAVSTRSTLAAEAKIIRGSSGSGSSSSRSSSRSSSGSSCDESEREGDAECYPGEKSNEAETLAGEPPWRKENALCVTSISNEGWSSPSPFTPWRSACGEIIASGSRIPSCRRHERVVWRTPHGDGSNLAVNPSPRASNRATQNLATCSLVFGHDVWPRVKGASFLLEDDETSLGLNEAIMWAKVNPFSPLNTGCRIMPF